MYCPRVTNTRFILRNAFEGFLRRIDQDWFVIESVHFLARRLQLSLMINLVVADAVRTIPKSVWTSKDLRLSSCTYTQNIGMSFGTICYMCKLTGFNV